MPAVHETAYPRLKEAVTPTDLAEVYTPTEKEIALAIDTSPRPEARLGFLRPLKTFQRLRHLGPPGGVPRRIGGPVGKPAGRGGRATSAVAVPGRSHGGRGRVGRSTGNPSASTSWISGSSASCWS
mgnify:CR=1 FL=1